MKVNSIVLDVTRSDHETPLIKTVCLDNLQKFEQRNEARDYWTPISKCNLFL